MFNVNGWQDIAAIASLIVIAFSVIRWLASRGKNTVTKGSGIGNRSKKSFDSLSPEQKSLVIAIQDWSRENNIRDSNGRLLSFQDTPDPNKELTRLRKEAEARGFKYIPKKK